MTPLSSAPTPFKLAINRFGASAKAKLNNPTATGSPEDQLRAPFESLLADIAAILIVQGKVVAVGESALGDLKTRPDYAVTVNGPLVGFVELKAPGKGADPRKFKDAHDKAQWAKLKSLPNLIYTDGNEFSLWQSGELVGHIEKLTGDIETSGSKLAAAESLLGLFENFLQWQPLPPRSARELAHVSARLCRLLRDEVTEQLAQKSAALTDLAADWRKLLFPDASDERFADGYAQAVTFGLLMARAKKIPLAQAGGLQQVAQALGKSSSLIGTALKLLTDSAENQQTLKTSIGTLTRVLDVVDWDTISKGKSDAWLYFYEDFLEVYDNTLRKLTGSYYTPPEVVESMVRLVDEALRTPRFGLGQKGIASPTVVVADPATGTGTFLLGVLRRIAQIVTDNGGAGTVPAEINAAVARLIAFEMQLGPFAVAQLRLLAEVVALTGDAPKTPLRMFVTDTLGNPDDDASWIPGFLAPIAQSRREANKVKRDEAITVVIGNPPYKEKAKGRGGWVEGEGSKNQMHAPLADWMPPREWGISAHSKHLRNLYIYFWRWATWKVFDLPKPGSTEAKAKPNQPAKAGIVCYITVAGFLDGPGFQKMRDYLRRTCDDIWVIDCSPEGHQPEVNTRIFQGVQQPICIVLASRSKECNAETPAQVRFLALPNGRRDEKFTALADLTLSDSAWVDCPTVWRAPFLPASTGAWATFPALEDFFVYNGSGVQPKRTWVIAPDSESLVERWNTLLHAPNSEKEYLFHATLRNGVPADRHVRSIVREALPGYAPNLTPIIDEKGTCLTPIPYAFRSFNRLWIIPDVRVVTQPNSALWLAPQRQIFVTASNDFAPSSGPALTLSALPPDLNYYNGRGGRVFPLWRNAAATESNVSPALLAFLTQQFGAPVTPEDVMAYIAAVAAHPAYTAKFHDDLSTPGLRIPITADATVFTDAVALGRHVIWLHTFGERMADAKAHRPQQPPRMPKGEQPTIPAVGAISQAPDAMPDVMSYDADKRRLIVGSGYIDNVPAAVWHYEVSGKQVLTQWFSYRKKNRDRPIIGDRREPSPLGKIQPDYWLAEYTDELLNVLNVLGSLVALEPAQAALLERICGGPCASLDTLRAAGALGVTNSAGASKSVGAENVKQPELF